MSTAAEARDPAADTVKEFIDLLYGTNAEGYLYIWTLPNKLSHWFRANDIQSMAEAAARLSAGHDTYFSVALHPKKLGQHERGEGDVVKGIPGVWCDIDFGAEGHKATGNPPDLAGAIAIVRAFPIKPTVVVHSGHGLHGWWLFAEPWTFDTNAEREEAQHLVMRFQKTIAQKAAELGWRMDSTFNLAQVLRLPGTWNLKTAPVEVRVISANPGRRYSRDDLEPFLIDLEAWEKARPVELPTDLPKVDVETLKLTNWIKDLITEGGDPKHYRSRSDAAWKATLECVENGLDDATIAGIFFDPNNVIGEKAREQGRRWFASELGRARKKSKFVILQTDEPGNGSRPKVRSTNQRPGPEAPTPAEQDLGDKIVPLRTATGLGGTGRVTRDEEDADEDGEVTTKGQRRCTQLGNSERLMDQFGDRLLYSHIWSCWLYWDGRRWKKDESGQVVRWAKDVVIDIYQEAHEATTKTRRRELASWARASEAEKHLNAMISLARSARPISIGCFDTDPWLLNFRNGTVDLRTGELREHCKADFITKLIDLDYDPEAECPLWLSVLERVLPDRAVRDFVQRAAGYSATGSARERKLIIPHGSGRNGKGLVLQTFKNVLGEYAVRAPAETFMAKRDGAIPNDVAQLRGSRFAFASETNEGHRLAEATIKDLTGGEDISARFMRGEWFSFPPTFTPWLATNHRPVIRGSDPAIWDRIALVPFTVRIPDDEQDPDLLEKLKPEYPGILAWITRGAIDWYRNGLGIPTAVRAATSSYQGEMDVIGTFISECCVIDSDRETGWVLASTLYETYTKWSEESGERPLPKRTLGLRLAERGYSPGRVGKTGSRGWVGLRLLTDGELEP